MTKVMFRVSCVGAFIIQLCSPAWCQAPRDVAPRPDQARLVQTSEVLGSDDLLDVMVSYCPELSRSFRINSTGDLFLPLLHKPIHAAGHTPAELGDMIASELRVENVLVEPAVNVSVLEYRSRPVSVFGAVNQPLTFQATGTTTLLDALSRAGGLKATAGSELLLTRKTVDADQKVKLVSQTIPITAVTAGQGEDVNPRLYGGEEIRIPDASSIFVVGDVRKPGMHPIQSEADMTVLKAISISEGLETFSSKTAFIYRRGLAGKPRSEIPIPISAIMSRKSPDMAMVSDDILYIPASNGKRLASKIFTQITGFGQAAGAGLLIYK